MMPSSLKIVSADEYNFDGMVGPTHFYGGLAKGNLLSQQSRHMVSSPRQAALQGLAKMKLMLQLGCKQGLLLPHPRPYLAGLRQLGFSGDDDDLLRQVTHEHFALFLEYSGSSSMWSANAATVSPSLDTIDQKLHLTPANLMTHKHRQIEVAYHVRHLRSIFPELYSFVLHPALPEHHDYRDEGAANHMRLAASHNEPGLEIFVYDQKTADDNLDPDFPLRQSYEASRIISLTHQLDPQKVVFAQQNRATIRKGVFHNDLIATSNENVLLFHEAAFENTAEVIDDIKARFKALSGKPLYCLNVSSNDLSVEEVVESFLFNSQIVTLDDQRMAIIAPEACRAHPAQSVIQNILDGDNPIDIVHYVDLSESMANGGGPACLRLRIVLTDRESALMTKKFILDMERIERLEKWVKMNYRQQIQIDDLRDIKFLREAREQYVQLEALFESF